MIPSFVAPSLLLSLLLSVVYASLFHLWRGRNLRDYFVFLIAAIAGFGAGQLAGAMIRLPMLQVGEVHVIEATVGALLGLTIAAMLVAPSRRRKRRTA
jgi:uncharacterized membrane protein YfcA